MCFNWALKYSLEQGPRDEPGSPQYDRRESSNEGSHLDEISASLGILRFRIKNKENRQYRSMVIFTLPVR